MAGDMIVALRLAYLGWNYHGVVKQGNLPTVESALTQALVSQGISARLRFTSRTDRGVSALENIAFYRGPPPDIALLNARLPIDIAVWGMARTERPPKPTMRVYAYAFPFRLEGTEELLRVAASQIGIKSVESFRVRTGENFTYVEICGKSFRRNEIRRLMGTLIELSMGRKVSLAPPEGLILLRTVTDLLWEETSKRKLFLMRKMIERSIWRLESSRLLHDLLGTTSS